MKINEKNLYTFANSKPVDKEGEKIILLGCEFS